jgi:hypothetical protein
MATSTAKSAEYRRPRASGRAASRTGPGAVSTQTVARAAILLAPVLEKDELALDDGDLLAVFGLARHLTQRAAAGRTVPVRLVEHVHHLDVRQPRLRLRAMPALRRGSRRGRGGRHGRRPLLRRRVEEGPLALHQDLLQRVELPLGGAHTVAAQVTQFAREVLQLGVELVVLALQELRDLPQDLRIANRIEVEHIGMTSPRRAGGKIFARSATTNGAGESSTRPTNALPSRKSCNSLIVSRTTRAVASRHKHAKRPCSRRLA